MFTPVWKTFNKGIHPSTKKVKERIGIHGFISMEKVRTEEDIMGIISKYIEVHIMSNILDIPNQRPCFKCYLMGNRSHQPCSRLVD